MARTLGRLTATKIRLAKPKTGADGKAKAALLCDGGGLWLQVTSGTAGQVNKSWIFRYATPDVRVSQKGRTYRRERQMGLGALHTVTLADAREMARQARLAVLHGKDPLDIKNASRAAVRGARANRYTFAAAAEAYLQRFEDGWKNPRHRAQWRNTLRDYMLPVLGALDVAEIGTDAVLRVLEPIWTKVPETASRVRGRIETVLDFAGRNGSNPARWKGHLEHRLAKRNKRRTVKHLAALPYNEVSSFITTLRSVDSIPARALQFNILCATRTNETVGARWDEIDLANRLWTIPANRTKRDREHRVPLSDAAIAVLAFMSSIRQDDRVFPIGYEAMFSCLKDIRGDLTVHGFRATFRSWAGARTDHPRDVCEAALGHSVGNAVEAAYMREDLLTKRQRLMSDWAAFCVPS